MALPAAVLAGIDRYVAAAPPLTERQQRIVQASLAPTQTAQATVQAA